MAKQKKNDSEYSFIGLKITSYSASVNSSINYEVMDKRRAQPDTKVFSFDTHLEIKGRSIYPEESVDEIYSLSVYASIREEERLASKLDDYHAVDDEWQPIYRKVKGMQVPAYNMPKGVGHLERIRGSRDWSGFMMLPQKTVTDMLILLPHAQPLYVSIKRRREGKIYFITHFSLQTNDPVES